MTLGPSIGLATVGNVIIMALFGIGMGGVLAAISRRGTVQVGVVRRLLVACGVLTVVLVAAVVIGT